MRVCFLGGTRYARPLDQTSERKFRALKDLGELFVVGFSQSAWPRRFEQHAHFYLLPNLPLPVLRYVAMFTVGPLLALWCVLRHGVLVLVAQSPYEGFAAAWAKLLARVLGRRVALVVESHGDFEVSLFLQRQVFFRRLYRFLMRSCARFALKQADLLRAVSSSTRQQLERRAPQKPLFLFPAWTDIDLFLRAGMEKCRNSAQTILYAGVLTPGKGVHHLVSSFAKIASDFPQVRLAIVGREQNKTYVAQLKAQTEHCGLDGRVEFVGEVPQAKLAETMREASVFVLPSLSEGLGRVVIEAMAVGKPVIGSREGGIAELIREGETGFLILPGDEAALADRLRWVLEHPAEAEQMGRRARAFAARFFSTEKYLQGYGQVFEAAQALAGGQE